MPQPRVTVVGGGFAGLSAACHLAHAGARVTVLERASQVGGKAGRRSQDGFTWDTGPTLLTMPDVLDGVLQLAGMRLRDEVPLHALAPLCRYHFATGSGFDHLADVEATAAQIAHFAPEDARAWPRFVAWADEVFTSVGDEFLTEPFEGLMGFATRMARRGPRALWHGLSFGTLDQLGRRFFQSVELQQFVGRLATYVGGDPARTSAAFGMIASVEGRGDAVYPTGGIAAVAQALARAASKLGVELCTGMEVTRIGQRDGRWTVITRDGEMLDSDALVLNLDPAFAATLAEPGSALEGALAPRGATRTRSLSGVALLYGLRGRSSGLALHNVFFPERYADEFEAIFERQAITETPTFYVAAPTPVDPESAPAGDEAIYVLVNAPPRPDLALDAIADRLEPLLARALEPAAPGFRERIATRVVLGPKDFASTGSLDGALYGMAPHGLFAPFQRPSQRLGPPRVYLAGGATHPGGGVPMATLSGRHAALLAAADLGLAAAQQVSA